MGVLDRLRERGAERSALRTDNARLREERRILIENGSLALEHADMLELQLAEDEAGWRKLNDETEGDWSMDRRRKAVVLARLMALRNPLVRRQVRTQVAYVFGQGVNILATDDDANAILQDFRDDQRNRAVITSPLALAERERDLQTDGELFLSLWTDRADFAVTVRSLPTLQIEHVVTNPNDRQEPWFYLRHYRLRSNDGLEDRYAAYVDYRYARWLESEPGDVPDVITFEGHDWRVELDADDEPVPVMHVRVGHVGEMKRGLPEVLAMMDWATAYKVWLEDWASIARSLARFAWKVSTTGNAANAAARLGSTLGTSLGEDNPAPVTGSAFVQNPGTDLQPIRTAGANASADDGLQIRKMASAGSSFPDTILSADPDMGNLATARTLDRPTELTIVMRQELWRDVLRELALFVLAAAVEEGELQGNVDTTRGNLRLELTGEGDATVEIDFPPVLERDTEAAIKAAVSAATLDGKALAGTVPPRVLASYMLTALGIDDQDEILGALFPNEDDPLGIAPVEPDPEAEAAEEALTEAARGLRDAVEKLAAV